MPIYEYCCDNCRQIFEEWTRHIDDNAAQTCPECGKTARRIVSNTSFVLKGGGWYVTDYGYRKGKTEKADSLDSPAAGQTQSAGEKEAPGVKAADAPGTKAAVTGSGKNLPTAPAGKPAAPPALS